MKKSFSLFIISFFIFFACAPQEIYRIIADVDSYIIEQPDSALQVLNSVDSTALISSNLKAKHALLYSMALDKNYIDLTDDSIARVAVNYYAVHGSCQEKARAFYYLGRVKFNAHEYDEAILAYSRAEKAAEECDSLYLGMIKIAMADTYNRRYNSIEELRCASEAYKIFVDLKHDEYIRPAYYRLAVSYQNVNEYDKAIKIYHDLMASPVTDYYKVESTLSAAQLALRDSDNDIEMVLNDYQTVINDYGWELNNLDKAAYSYALNVAGITDEICLLDSTSSSLFWAYKAAKHNLDYEQALYFLEKVSKMQSEEVSEVLKESLASYQRDYYQALADINDNKAKTRMTAIFAIVILSILLIIIIMAVLLLYIRKQRLKFEKSLEYAEEINRQLSESHREDYSKQKRQFLSLYRSKFETIGELSNQYLRNKDRFDVEAVIYKKVLMMIDDIRSDGNRRHEFETMLDDDLDYIMTNLRVEMPKFKEVDYAIFSYLVAGFDATTISRLLDMTVNNVYARKHRIRVRIEEKCPEHLAQFLEILTD